MVSRSDAMDSRQSGRASRRRLGLRRWRRSTPNALVGRRRRRPGAAASRCIGAAVTLRAALSDVLPGAKTLGRGSKPGIAPYTDHDHRPPPEQLALATRAVAARGTGHALRDQALPAQRQHQPRAARVAAGASAGQVAGHHRWRRHGRRDRRRHRVPGRQGRRSAAAGRRHAGAPALHLLAALRRRLGDVAAADDVDPRPHPQVGAVLRQADHAPHRRHACSAPS